MAIHSRRAFGWGFLVLVAAFAGPCLGIVDVVGSGTSTTLMINQTTTSFSTTVVLELRQWVETNMAPGVQLTSTACAGDDFAVMALSNNALISWGSNANGQLGISNSVSGSTVFKYPQLVNVTALQGRVVRNLTCMASSAVLATSDGYLYAWGLNSGGQLGVGDLTTRYEPTLVNMTDSTGAPVNTTLCSFMKASTNFIQILCENGTVVLGWGANSNGQLGIGSTASPQTSPARATLTALAGGVIRQLAVGPAGVALLVDNGTALVPFVYGSNSGIRANCRATAATTSASRIDLLDVLLTTTAGLAPAKMFWNTQLYFILRNGSSGVETSIWGCTSTSTTTPQLVNGDIQSTYGATQADPIYIEDVDWFLKTFLIKPVYNTSTRLGELWDSGNARLSLTRGATSIIQAPTLNFWLALRSTPEIPTPYPGRAPRITFSEPVLSLLRKPTTNIATTTDVEYIFNGVNYLTRMVSTGSNHTLVLLSNGTLLGFGDNRAGQLSPALPAFVDTPSAIDSSYFSGKTLVKVQTGRSHSAILAQDGTLFLWGANTAGQLCWGPAGPSVTGPLNETSLSVRNGTSLNLGGPITNMWTGWDGTMLHVGSTGRLYACGNHVNAQLGTSTPFTNLTTPTAVVNITGGLLRYRTVVDVFMGERATHIIADDYYYGDRQLFRSGIDLCNVVTSGTFGLLTLPGVTSEVDVIKVASTQSHVVFWYTTGLYDTYGNIYGCGDPRYLRGYVYPPEQPPPTGPPSGATTPGFRNSPPGEQVTLLSNGSFSGLTVAPPPGTQPGDLYRVYDIGANGNVGTYFVLKGINGTYTDERILYQTGLLVQETQEIDQSYSDPYAVQATGSMVNLIQVPQRTAAPFVLVATASVLSPVAPPLAPPPVGGPAPVAKPVTSPERTGLEPPAIVGIVLGTCIGAVAIIAVITTFVVAFNPSASVSSYQKAFINNSNAAQLGDDSRPITARDITQRISKVKYPQ